MKLEISLNQIIRRENIDDEMNADKVPAIILFLEKLSIVGIDQLLVSSYAVTEPR